MDYGISIYVHIFILVHTVDHQMLLNDSVHTL